MGLIEFALLCAFMVQMWIFELGLGVQYGCDCVVGLLVIFGFKIWTFVHWLVGFNELVLFYALME